jgi:hypothetical protein
VRRLEEGLVKPKDEPQLLYGEKVEAFKDAGI